MVVVVVKNGGLKYKLECKMEFKSNLEYDFGIQNFDAKGQLSQCELKAFVFKVTERYRSDHMIRFFNSQIL